MNRADRMLAVLKDGQWHSRHELHERGGFYLTNNAASELRQRGLVVEKRTHRRNIEYRLLSESMADWRWLLSESPASPPERNPAARTAHGGMTRGLTEQPTNSAGVAPHHPNADTARLLTTLPRNLPAPGPKPPLAGFASPQVPGQLVLAGGHVVLEGDEQSGGINGAGRVRSRPVETGDQHGGGGARHVA